MSAANQPFSISPKSSGESVTLIAHFYRGEIARMAGWRDRIDRTTNWAITATGAMLSLSLSTPTSHHSVIIFAMLLVLLLLLIEGRRYRFFDVYRWRVRALERYYFAELLDPRAPPGEEWVVSLANDLRVPRFRIGLREAISRRLKRNYGWMYLILLLAWLLKITAPILEQDQQGLDVDHAFENIVAAAAAGALPGWFVLSFVALFYAIIAIMLLQRGPRAGFDDGTVHV